jgi:hypothetical protein
MLSHRTSGLIVRRKLSLDVTLVWLKCCKCDCGSQTRDCTKANTNSHRTPEDDIADIDLGDPGLQKAASKIQATFRKRTTAAPKKPATAVAATQNREQQEWSTCPLPVLAVHIVKLTLVFACCSCQHWRAWNERAYLSVWCTWTLPFVCL